MQANKKELIRRLKPLGVREGVRMSELTSFRIGGPAFALAEPSTREELLTILGAAKACDVEVFLMGNGTNLLVSDEGLDKLVVRIGEGFSCMKRTTSGMEAGAGTLISAFSRFAAAEGLRGIEWASGIPGSVGGAVAMNAGAYGGEIKDALCRVDYLENGEFFSVQPKPGDFSYRKSAFSGPGRVVVAAEFALTCDESAEVFARIDDFTRRRAEKQPLEYPSAGSVFKRPEGHFTGALIEAAGMKGMRLGGAQVSEKHAGFIVNAGGATFKDVLGLIRAVQARVFETSGITLETEIKIIGAAE
ncbi:MAG: UDP-N-acetylmuramate dehydrogenase [Eubacteriales bacterium]|nr:UDP-N-acetylmuramate dehydrogenase [Eubacteriales bacterium]